MQLTGQDIVPECRVGQLTLARGSCVPCCLDWTTAWAQPGTARTQPAAQKVAIPWPGRSPAVW